MVGKNESRSLVKEMAYDSCGYVDELAEMDNESSLVAEASIEWMGVLMMPPPLMML